MILLNETDLMPQSGTQRNETKARTKKADKMQEPEKVVKGIGAIQARETD